MIITRTPFRISFFGGGTDYPTWVQEHGGAVLSSTIDKYCYISVRKLPPFFEHKHRIVYSKIENVKTINEIDHPAVRAVLSWSGVRDGLEIHHDGDLPARSGLGSSSSFTVGLLSAIQAMEGSMYSKKDLALNAINIEQSILEEQVGSQDQIAVAYGGFNHIRFLRDNSFDVEPILIPAPRKALLESHLMLFFTGFSRISSDIAKATVDNINKNQLSLMRMSSMVNESIDILKSSKRSMLEFGELLHSSWQIKRTLSNLVTNAEIDAMYEDAISAGAVGGKILGAGGGGFLLIFADPKFHGKIKQKLLDLVYVPIKFENSGSKVVLYEPDGF